MVLQHPSPHVPTEPVFVGFAGRMGAGKTSAAKYLSCEYGFQYTRYSQVLQEWLSSGVSDRDRLQQVGWEVMAGGLQGELNARVIAGLDRSRSAAIDGLRHWVDLQSLSSTFGASFEMIFLVARHDHRFERLQARFSTLADFHAADSHPVEAHIDDLRPRASIVIPNDDSPEHLYQQLGAWMVTRSSGDRP
jgi:dephospho-CoA kinase